MFRDLAAILGFFLEILFNPVFWAAIVLWIMYAKKKTRGLKKWAIVCTVIVVVVHLVLIPLSRYLTGYYQGEPTQATSSATTQQTEQTQAISINVDTEKQSKINKLKNKFEETKKYVLEMDNATTEIDKDIKDLSKKSNETDDIQKSITFLQLQENKYEEAINNLAKIFVPEIFKEYHFYLVEYYTSGRQWTSYMISSYLALSNPDRNIDYSKIDSLHDDAFNAKTRADQEFDRVLKNLFDEADELGIILE